MGFGQNALIVCLFLSIVLYMSGAPRLLDGDIFSTFFNVDQGNPRISDQAGGVLPQNPQSNAPQVTNGVSSGVWSITDGLSLVFGFIKFLINIVSEPVALLTIVGLPSQLVMIIGVPIAMLMFIGIIALVRGVFSW